MKKKQTKKPVAGKTATGKNKRTVKSSASSGRAAQPAKRTSSAQKSEKKEKRLSDFRYPKKRPNDSQIVHPAYIYKKAGDEFEYLSITHDTKKSNRSKVRGLEHNPDPKKKNEKAYIKKKAERKKDKDFGPRLKGWKFWSQKDKDVVNELIAKNNKKRKDG